MSNTTTDVDDVTLWRAEQFAELDFGSDDSLTLAESKDLDGFPLHYSKAKKLLDQGATHEQVVAIFRN